MSLAVDFSHHRSADQAVLQRLMRLALYQPDIPQNAGAILRLAACFAVPVDIIEPCGFPLDDRKLRRAGMDYLDRVELARHSSWQAYLQVRGQVHGQARQNSRPSGRLVLLTTAGDTRFPDIAFQTDDILLLGRESAGVPAEVHDAADLRLRIPLQPGLRSLNVALSAAMVLSEALRQTRSFPVS